MLLAKIFEIILVVLSRRSVTNHDQFFRPSLGGIRRILQELPERVPNAFLGACVRLDFVESCAILIDCLEIDVILFVPNVILSVEITQRAVQAVL